MLVKERFRSDLVIFCLRLFTWKTAVTKTFLYPEGNGQFCLMNYLMSLSLKCWIISMYFHHFSAMYAIVTPWKFIAVPEYWALMTILCTSRAEIKIPQLPKYLPLHGMIYENLSLKRLSVFTESEIKKFQAVVILFFFYQSDTGASLPTLQWVIWENRVQDFLCVFSNHCGSSGVSQKNSELKSFIFTSLNDAHPSHDWSFMESESGRTSIYCPGIQFSPRYWP